jgi:HlyD family secretion protein
MSASTRPIGRMAATLGIASLSLLTACETETLPDANGNFEADEVLVSAQTSGQLERFKVREGVAVREGDTVALVDTVQLGLERQQMIAQQRALRLQREELMRQSAAVATQREFAQRTLTRTLRLASGGAATAAQRDLAERDTRVLTEQGRGSAAGIERLGAEGDALTARLALLSDRLRRAQVRNPVSGTVLVTYVHEGEVIQPGQALYRIANLDTLTVRAYVSGRQLAGIRLGDSVDVRTDGADGGVQRHRGRVAWISSRAEFTPTPVQTREDRTDFVYAVKIRVPNPDGTLKIGMPADVTLGTPAATP